MRQYLLLFLLLSGFARAQSETVDSLVYFESNFALDSYRISAAEKARIDSLFTVVPFSILKKVEIYGHTDSLADNQYNLELSKKRVQSLLQHLVYLGLDPRKVDTDHFGEEKPKYRHNSADFYRNRRVELILFIDASLIPPPEQKLSDNPFEKGNKIRLPNLIFIGNQPIPLSESFSTLRELLYVMRMYPDLSIELQGHVCCSNDEQLSLERARMVYYYLIANGIDENRLSYEAFGNTQPLYKEVDERSRQLNRRVEVLVKDNTGRKVPVEQDGDKLEIMAPLLSVSFPQNSARLAPSGDFNLEMVAEMMKKSEGLKYRFVVFNNIDDQRLTKLRASNISRTLRKKGVRYKSYAVEHQPAPDWMTSSVNDNTILLYISETK